MVYKCQFNLIDNETGEILTRNKVYEYNTKVSDCHFTLLNWLLCFERGLKTKRNLTIQIVANEFLPPIQKDIF